MPWSESFDSVWRHLNRLFRTRNLRLALTQIGTRYTPKLRQLKMNDLARIRAFILVVQLGSLSAASRQLNTSVTSVSRQVNSLEAELKIRLLNRSSRQLALTEAGKLFFERACAISAELRSAMDEATSFEKNIKGVLRVSLRASVGALVIVPALPLFLARHPELKVHVSLSESRSDLIANDIDVAVWMGNIPDADLVARLLSHGKRVVCASPQYLAKNGLPLTPDDLSRHNCLLFDSPTYGNTWTFNHGSEKHTVDVSNSSIQTNSANVLYAAAEAGAGIVVMHEWSARPLIKAGRLVQILSDYQVTYSPTGGNLYAVYASSKGLSRKIRAFVDFLAELFSED